MTEFIINIFSALDDLIPLFDLKDQEFLVKNMNMILKKINNQELNLSQSQ